ncbi:hypothetical protein HZ326_29031 [Fusarium oxysporum f. sp. albedinis]|nr:hypothetical protein HZ326_29031 [Fusarium oxysporum f. sp. albedinis]
MMEITCGKKSIYSFTSRFQWMSAQCGVRAACFMRSCLLQTGAALPRVKLSWNLIVNGNSVACFHSLPLFHYFYNGLI